MRKWKWNWGTGLAIALGLFVLSMGYTMYLVFQQRFDLVTTNYYEEELAYQETIDRKEQALELNESCKLELKDGQLRLDFPSELEGLQATAEILMYCQTDARNDFTIAEENWTIKDLTLPAGKLTTGKWIAKITLDTETEEYYFDPSITLP